MKVKGMFAEIGTRMIDGKRVTISEHKLMRFFRFGKINIPAENLEQAIDRYRASMAKHSRVTV